MNKIESPDTFLEKIITDTWEDKIMWGEFEFEYGKRYLAIINIKETKKFLRLEVFDVSGYSFVKIDFHNTIDNISFENITAKDDMPRVTRLILAIKRQLNAEVFKRVLNK